MKFQSVNPFVSKTVLVGLISSTESELYSKLSLFSKKEDLEYNLTIYYFTISLMRFNLFFTLSEKLSRALFIKSAQWSIKEEFKNSISTKDLLEKTQNQYFTKLNREIIKSLIIKHSINDVNISHDCPIGMIFNLELFEYLSILNNIAHVKKG